MTALDPLIYQLRETIRAIEIRREQLANTLTTIYKTVEELKRSVEELLRLIEEYRERARRGEGEGTLEVIRGKLLHLWAKLRDLLVQLYGIAGNIYSALGITQVALHKLLERLEATAIKLRQLCARPETLKQGADLYREVGKIVEELKSFEIVLSELKNAIEETMKIVEKVKELPTTITVERPVKIVAVEFF